MYSLEGVFSIVAWSTMSFSHKIWCMLATAGSNLNSASKATNIDNVHIYLSHIEARSVCRRLRLPSSWSVLALAWRQWWVSCRSFDIKHHASSLSRIVKYDNHGINPDQRINGHILNQMCSTKQFSVLKLLLLLLSGVSSLRTIWDIELDGEHVCKVHRISVI